ncbi:hypothetical protein F5Y01DRAFT_201754 [Xylaria sp. FL0043]|nr:hypothetical protein F5Y01DRAFT_201754 [Xylaria sp. FL0043]
MLRALDMGSHLGIGVGSPDSLPAPLDILRQPPSELGIYVFLIAVGTPGVNTTCCMTHCLTTFMIRTIGVVSWGWSIIGIRISIWTERNRKGIYIGNLRALLGHPIVRCFVHALLQISEHTSPNWDFSKQGSLYNITAQERGKLAFLHIGGTYIGVYRRAKKNTIRRTYHYYYLYVVSTR